MTSIAQPIHTLPFVDGNGKLTPTSTLWAQQVTQLQILAGDGSPEGVIEAQAKTLYMDRLGSAGAVLWIKLRPDIGGNRKNGWVLI